MLGVDLRNVHDHGRELLGVATKHAWGYPFPQPDYLMTTTQRSHVSQITATTQPDCVGWTGLCGFRGPVLPTLDRSFPLSSVRVRPGSVRYHFGAEGCSFRGDEIKLAMGAAECRDFLPSLFGFSPQISAVVYR